jgi:short-subunit dehydrogenase
LPKKPAARKKARPVTLVTGASGGIGAALAGVFAEHGHEVVLVGRRKAHLEDVARAITAAGRKPPHVIVADLTDAKAPSRLARGLTARGLEVRFLVNNAGYGLWGKAADIDLNDQLRMIDLNARVVTDLSLRFAETLARRRGGILNVASIAGFLPGPRLAVYHATKAYVVSLSEALWSELKPRGVRVSALCPGPVESGFMGRAGVPSGVMPDLLYVPAEKVAQAGYAGLMRGERVIVPGLLNKLVIAIGRFIPGLMVAGRFSGLVARGRR